MSHFCKRNKREKTMHLFHLVYLTLLALMLSACSDGDKSSSEVFNVGGSINGLSGLITLKVSGDQITTNRNGDFLVESELSIGDDYKLSVLTHPEGQLCSVENGEGSVGEDGVSPISIVCVDISRQLSGISSGLLGEIELQLSSGSLVETLIVTGDEFSFLNSLAFGSAYEVSISQPAQNQDCWLYNAEGSVSAESPTLVNLSCGSVLTDMTGEAVGIGGSAVLELRSGGNTEQVSVSGANFNFDTGLVVGELYNVELISAPDGQDCTLSGESGTATLNTTAVVVLSCSDTIYTVTGSVEGLTGNLELTLVTPVGHEVLTPSNGEFSFSSLLKFGYRYSVIVTQQPEGIECSASNGTGWVPDDGVPTIVIGCRVATFQVSGTTSGLTGTLGLSLVTATSQEQLELTGTSFTFVQEIEVGGSYEVIITRQPSGQACALSDFSGSVLVSGIIPVIANCEDLSTETASLSGTIGYASNTRFDSDLNSSTMASVNNSSFVTAQAIPNIVTVQGFATNLPTGNPGDNFEHVNDLQDFYRVTLQGGQGLRLQIVDYDQFEVNGSFEGDLDLYLFDDNFNMVSYSVLDSEFEAITVEDSGQYYVQVFAYSGSSKYVLDIAGASLPGVVNQSVDFMPNEAVIKMNSQEKVNSSVRARTDLRLRHQDLRRANLVSFSSTAASVLTSASGNKSKAINSADELADLNPESYEKFVTINKIKELSLDPGVSYAEPNYLRNTQLTPNDEYYSAQWHYPAMNLPQAWDITTGTSSAGEDDVIVAVVDTGVFLSHPDLSGKLVPGYDFISDPSRSLDGNGIDNNPDDPGDNTVLGRSSWHGTHVAGTVAANTNDEAGIAGVSWGAKVMPLRALGAFGGTSYDIMQSVRFAAGLSNDSGTLPSQRADIINLSLGGGAFSNIESELYQQVYNMGIIVVAAAGNDSSLIPFYPASYNGVISVSALDARNELAPYSNFGSYIDIAAPGGDVSVDVTGDGHGDGVLSLLVDDSSGTRLPIIGFNQGTSMAAPHVAGMMALMRSVYPGLDASMVDVLLQNGMLTSEAGEAGRDDTFGFGIANALKSVQAAQALAAGDDLPDLPATVVASPAILNFGLLSSGQVSISNEGGGEPSVSSIVPSDSWITITSENIDQVGMGTYGISVAREDLDDGLYVGTITFNFDGASAISVSVSMTVGDVDNTGELANLFTILVDPLSRETIAYALAVDNGDGTASYSVEDVPAGSYVLVAGSDIDNDLVLCQTGEACGAYPSLGGLFYIDVNGSDVSELDFNADIVSGFGSLGVNNTSSLQNDLPGQELPTRPRIEH